MYSGSLYSNTVFTYLFDSQSSRAIPSTIQRYSTLLIWSSPIKALLKQKPSCRSPAIFTSDVQLNSFLVMNWKYFRKQQRNVREFFWILPFDDGSALYSQASLLHYIRPSSLTHVIVFALRVLLLHDRLRTIGAERQFFVCHSSQMSEEKKDEPPLPQCWVRLPSLWDFPWSQYFLRQRRSVVRSS